MNQQSSQKALLKSSKINKRRHKDESKVQRLLSRALRELPISGAGTTGSLMGNNCGGGVQSTATLPPQIDAHRHQFDNNSSNNNQQDFKCDTSNQRSAAYRGPLKAGARVLSEEQRLALEQGGGEFGKDPRRVIRRKVDVMLHHIWRSHQNAVNMAKQVSRLLDIVRQTQREESPASSMVSPSENACREATINALMRKGGAGAEPQEENQRLRSLQKLSLNKQPIHNNDRSILDQPQQRITEAIYSELVRHKNYVDPSIEPSIDADISRIAPSTGVKSLNKLKQQPRVLMPQSGRNDVLNHTFSNQVSATAQQYLLISRQTTRVATGGSQMLVHQSMSEASRSHDQQEVGDNTGSNNHTYSYDQRGAGKPDHTSKHNSPQKTQHKVSAINGPGKQEGQKRKRGRPPKNPPKSENSRLQGESVEQPQASQQQLQQTLDLDSKKLEEAQNDDDPPIIDASTFQLRPSPQHKTISDHNKDDQVGPSSSGYKVQRVSKNETTGPSTEKQDSEEKGQLSKESNINQSDHQPSSAESEEEESEESDDEDGSMSSDDDDSKQKRKSIAEKSIAKPSVTKSQYNQRKPEPKFYKSNLGVGNQSQQIEKNSGQPTAENTAIKEEAKYNQKIVYQQLQERQISIPDNPYVITPDRMPSRNNGIMIHHNDLTGTNYGEIGYGLEPFMPKMPRGDDFGFGMNQDVNMEAGYLEEGVRGVMGTRRSNPNWGGQPSGSFDIQDGGYFPLYSQQSFQIYNATPDPNFLAPTLSKSQFQQPVISPRPSPALGASGMSFNNFGGSGTGPSQLMSQIIDGMRVQLNSYNTSSNVHQMDPQLPSRYFQQQQNEYTGTFGGHLYEDSPKNYKNNCLESESEQSLHK